MLQWILAERWLLEDSGWKGNLGERDEGQQVCESGINREGAIVTSHLLWTADLNSFRACDPQVERLLSTLNHSKRGT